MFLNEPTNDVEYFFSMCHQNACSRGLTIAKAYMSEKKNNNGDAHRLITNERFVHFDFMVT